jgi:hypothetical protein
MIQRILHNKDLFANVVLILMAASLFADIAIPGEQHTNKISANNRMLCHVIQIAILGAMCVFVYYNYTLPQIPAVMFWELSLVIFLFLSAFHAASISSHDQLVTFSKYIYWPIGYFFFRILADDVRGYTTKLLGLIICLSIFAVWYYVSQLEFRAELAETFGSASSNVGWKLLSIFSVSLCLISARDRKGYIVGAVVLLLAPFSLKRGAILAETALCTSLILASYRLGRLCRFIRKNAVLIMGIFFVWSLVLASQLQVIIERFSSLKDDGGSGRSQFYPLLLERWWKADFFHWICGFGFWSTPEYLDKVWIDHIYAHSDILEMLHDYGVIGVLSYLMILLGFFALFRHTWRLRNDGVIIAASIFSLFFISGIISGNVMFRETVYLMMPMGYMAGRLEKANKIRSSLNYEALSVRPKVLQGYAL